MNAKVMMMVWFLAMGFTLKPPIHDAYIWHQIEKQALVADLVEGAQE
jgi:hypothetical protein